jgi:hypothetical protein
VKAREGKALGEGVDIGTYQGAMVVSASRERERGRERNRLSQPLRGIDQGEPCRKVEPQKI